MQDLFWNKKETVNQFASRPCSKYITDEIDNILQKFDVKKAIDIGCGGGRYSVYLKNKAIDVFSIDKNEEMVKFVSGLNINASVCEMANINKKDETFDLALSIGVLHNATTEEEFYASVCEIARVLKKNAFALISVFTNDLITSDLTQTSENKFTLSEGRPPMVLYSREEIIDKFEKSGLKFIKIFEEHITDVGTGERNVLSLCFRKQ